MSDLPPMPAPVVATGAPLNALAIDARRLSRTFAIVGATVQALVDVDLAIAPKEIVAIIGRSGAGKSTLLNLIGALDRQYQGELRVFGQELKSLSDSQLSRFRNRQIGFVFQSFQLLPNLSVGENVMLLKRILAAIWRKMRSNAARVGCWARWSWPRALSKNPSKCRAVSGNGSRSPARCCSNRRCWFATNRPAVLMRRLRNKFCNYSKIYATNLPQRWS